MRKVSASFAIAACLMGICLAACEALGQRPRWASPARRHASAHTRRGRAPSVPTTQPKGVIPPVAGAMQNALASDPGVPTFPVYVSDSLNLDPQTLALYQQAANQLTGYAPVPNDRTNYYAWVIRNYTVLGWQGLVESLVANGQGTVVTVYVFPTCDVATAFGSDYTEQYLLANDGTIQYLGFSDPLGLAGQVPPDTEEY